MMERDGLLFSDGSITVFAEGWPMEKIEAERIEADKNTPIEDRTKIVRVLVEIDRIIFDPAEQPVATTSSKLLSDYTDAEIASEHRARAMRFLGDPRVSVGVAAPQPS
jgi:hypothetical protein